VTILKTEPVIAAILLVIAATITLLVAFGVQVTDVQREAIEGWVGAVLALGFLVRSKVAPTATPSVSVRTGTPSAPVPQAPAAP
jgi:hypothetical protein